jgi:hypothetical protein
MQYRPLGDTDIEVSLIALGTMTFGEQNTREEAFAAAGLRGWARGQLHRRGRDVPGAAASGNPGQPPSASSATGWRQSGRRDDADHWPQRSPGAAIATGMDHTAAAAAPEPRAYSRGVDAPWRACRPITSTFTRCTGPSASPTSSVSWATATREDDSIADRETLAALGELVTAGKVRHIGISNETPWGVMEYLRLAEERRPAAVVSIQNPYNLLNRSFEVGLAEMAIREQVGLLAYSPLAFGVLSGKYIGGAQTRGRALTLFERFSRYSGEQVEAAVEAYVRWPGRRARPGADGAGLRQQPPVHHQQHHRRHHPGTAEGNIDSVDIALDKALLRRARGTACTLHHSRALNVAANRCQHGDHCTSVRAPTRTGDDDGMASASDLTAFCCAGCLPPCWCSAPTIPRTFLGQLGAAPDNSSFGPVEALLGVVLLIGWVIYLRATFRSMGWLGIALGAALFACLIWLLIDFGMLSLDATGALPGSRWCWFPCCWRRACPGPISAASYRASSMWTTSTTDSAPTPPRRGPAQKKGGAQPPNGSSRREESRDGISVPG